MSWFAHKRYSSFHLALFWINCSGEARCRIVRTGMYLYGKSHMMQNSVVNSQHHLASHVSESPWKQTLQLHSHSNDCTLAIFWLWSHLESWARPTHISHSQIPDHIMWQSKCLLLWSPGVVYYAVIDT